MTARAAWRVSGAAVAVGVAWVLWRRRRVFWGHDVAGAFQTIAIGPVSFRRRLR